MNRKSPKETDCNFLLVRCASCSSPAGSGLLSGGWVPQSVTPSASRGLCKGRYGKYIAVDQASRFELVVNLKTARTMGFANPRSILLRADRVIE